MPARLIVHLPERASQLFTVDEGVSRILGRERGCDIVLDDPRVSKRHAALRWRDDGWAVVDLGSKNGTLVNGAASDRVLRDGDWISFGGVNAEFARLTREQLDRFERDCQRRRETSIVHGREQRAERDGVNLLRRLLRSSIELTGTERGFVLLLDRAGSLQAEIAAGYDGREEVTATFDGSRSLLERVRQTGRTLVITDAQTDVRFAGQPSVGRSGLRGLASVPILIDGAVRGFLYVDGRRPGLTISNLDVEILEGLAEQAAIALASLDIDRQIREMLSAADGVPYV